MNIPEVKAFFDNDSHTISYVVSDPETRHAAVIDSVLGFDYASGGLSYQLADDILAYIRAQDFIIDWLIETHVHADHLSAAPYLQQKIGGRIAISKHIVEVQEIFGKVFNAGTAFERDGSQFDRLLDDQDSYEIGSLQGRAIHTPGHTPACMAHIIGDAIFVGDTLFMPDGGTARADFPGGDARTLYQSIHKILAQPEEMRIFVCHDYMPDGRDLGYMTTVGEQKANNIHIGGGISEDEFVEMRERRDATLSMPKLILPSIQVNMRGGNMPPAEDNDEIYLKVPISGIRGK
ncbi:MBL fold metallo-hydrolase [Alphaproteobacteria bacterium]|nr:MBL fold metallo-hydrolase [Alphaproteobacteria bacterium]